MFPEFHVVMFDNPKSIASRFKTLISTVSKIFEFVVEAIVIVTFPFLKAVTIPRSFTEATLSSLDV